MSSILSFAWRRRQHIMKRDDSDVDSERSSEGGLLHVDTKVNITHNSMIFIPRSNEVVTPDGFKERRSMVDIRNVLFNESEVKRSPPITKNFEYVDDFQDLVDETEIDAGAQKLEKVTSNSFRKREVTMETPPIIFQDSRITSKDETEDSCYCNRESIQSKDSFPVLPPLPIRSWSTEGDGVASPGTILLSSRSGTSKWHHSSSSWGGSTNRTNASPFQAESPQLELGRTRTAVGNLLVSMQQQQQDPPGVTPLQNVSHRFSSTDLSWSQNPRGKNVESVCSPMINGPSVPNSQNTGRITVGSSNRSMSHILPAISEQPACVDQSRQQFKKKKKNLSGGNNDVDSRLFSPLTSKSQVSQNDNKPSPNDLPPLFVNPEVCALPIKLPSYTPTTSFLLMHQRLLDLEKQSIAPSQFQEQSIIEKKQNAGFTWTVTSCTNNSHSSGHSTGSKASKKTISSDSNSIVVFDEANPNHSILDSAQFSDRSIQKSKARSQRRKNEDLIISALERLQDNIQLISEVEGLIKLDMGTSGERIAEAHQQSMYDWFMPTSYDIEGILTGFSDTKRYLILDRIDLFLNEFINARDEKSDSSDMAFQNAQEALNFCKALVQMAIPESEKEDSSLQGTEEIGRWQFRSGMCEIIGLHTSKSSGTPQRGECDFSLFSLPEEGNDNCDTPMTSNLSIGASTLTTIVKDYDLKQVGGMTPRHTFGTSIALKQQEQPHLQLQYNGLYLRQAIQLFTTGIQKMTLACNSLSEIKGNLLTLSSFIDFANQIREAYLQLLSLSQNDLKSIVDAFEFELDTETAYADQFDEGICEIIDDDEPIRESPDMKRIASPIVFAETLGFGVLDNTDSSVVVSASKQSPQIRSLTATISPEVQEKLIEKFDSIDEKSATSDEVPIHDPVKEHCPIDIWRMKSVDSDDDDDNCSFVSLFVMRYRNLDTGFRLEV
jgi:hypothetical protein